MGFTTSNCKTSLHGPIAKITVNLLSVLGHISCLFFLVDRRQWPMR